MDQSSKVGSGKIWLLIMLFATSLLVNLYFYYDSHLSLKNASWKPPGWRLTWTVKAARDAERVAAMNCSGHGRAFLDGKVLLNRAHLELPGCECNTCYTGDECSTLIPDCPADAVSGDALFLENYWKDHKENTAVLVSGWHRMSYVFTPPSNFTSQELVKTIKRLHEIVGNAVAHDKYVIFGNGVTNLLNGFVISLSPNVTSNPSDPIKKVVAQVPYYPVFKKQTNFFNFKGYEWAGNASDHVKTTTPEDFIEFVTSPNNPDGKLMSQVIPGSKTIHDLVYYWPHFHAIQSKPYDEDIMLFAMSKFSGHAGSRFGWALIRDYALYEKMLTYMTSNTEGTPRETQLRTLYILNEINRQAKTDRDINLYGYRTLRKRWFALYLLVASSKRFTLQETKTEYCHYFKDIRLPSPSYGWIKCEWEEDVNCPEVLKNGKILTQGGELFEAGTRYARLSLIKTDDDFNQLMHYLSILVHAKRSPRYNNILEKPSVGESGSAGRPFI